MSRIGLQPITLPSGTNVTISESKVVVKGPKGQLTSPLMPRITVKQDGDTLTLERADEEKQTRAFHGLCRSLLYNAVVGVSQGSGHRLPRCGQGLHAGTAARLQPPDHLLHPQGDHHQRREKHGHQHRGD